MLIFLRILTWRDSSSDIHENGSIPGKKIDQFVQDFPFALITFLFELAFLEKKERTDARKMYTFSSKVLI